MLDYLFCRRLSSRLALIIPFIAVTFGNSMPLLANEGKDEPQVWVISYAVMLLFLGLVLAILLRPLKRNDSAFTFDEQREMKEEEMKKMKGH